MDEGGRDGRRNLLGRGEKYRLGKRREIVEDRRGVGKRKKGGGDD